MRQETGDWIRDLQSGSLDERLQEIYTDVDAQKARYIGLLKTFEKTFGPAQTEIFSAPGRTEVCGNHTDHQHGMVAAAAVDMDIIAVAERVDGPLIEVKSDNYPVMHLSLESLKPVPREKGTSVGLMRGVAAKLKKMGYRIGGFRAVMTSEVLGGSGLSSSAAFEVTVAAILSGLYNHMKVKAVEMAVASQYAENVYFGKPCGLMDQMASAMGGLTFMDFKDPDKPVIQKMDLDLASFGHSLCIVDTKGSHAHLTHEYAAVPADMQAVAKHFGKEVLRDVDPEVFYQAIPRLRRKLDDRKILRAMHFFREEDRVSAIRKTLETGDFEGFLRLINASGDSSFKYLQNVYPASAPAHQSLSVGLSVSEAILAGRGACRVHGGGFAGTIQAFVPDDLLPAYREALEHIFGQGACHVLRIRPWGGIRVFE